MTVTVFCGCVSKAFLDVSKEILRKAVGKYDDNSKSKKYQIRESNVDSNATHPDEYT